MTASALYEATVHHRRAEPAHQVRHSFRLAYLDLDELPQVLSARRGWSTGPAPVWFRRRDYFDGTDRPLRPAVLDMVEERTGRRPHGPVRILTQLRTLGWLFNPLTTYYCFEPDGETIAAVVLEVSNTPWHERFWYVIGPEVVGEGGASFPKQFHVSPFLPIDLDYRCRIDPPGEVLRLHLELSRPDGVGGQRPVFDAELTGRRLDLSAPVPLRARIRELTQTVSVSAGIYAHAAVLHRRGAPIHRHMATRPSTREGTPT